MVSRLPLRLHSKHEQNHYPIDVSECKKVPALALAWVSIPSALHAAVGASSASPPLPSLLCDRTINVGSLVAPRMRSVTLPRTQRWNPPRPCVVKASISHPPNTQVPASTLPISATSMSASATSERTAMDQVTARLRSPATLARSLSARS